MVDRAAKSLSEIEINSRVGLERPEIVYAHDPLQVRQDFSSPKQLT